MMTLHRDKEIDQLNEHSIYNQEENALNKKRI